MKKLYIIIVIALLGFAATAQIVNIPDANFKYLLVHSSTNNSTAYDCANIFGYYPIDTNNNGEIEYSEALNVCQLILINANISDLTGIEAFTNLKGLRCDHNNLTSLNVSQLTHLEGLGCWQNQITSLDIGTLPNLKTLSCQNNQITSLNFANNPLLENVFCNNNQLSSLDFSNNPLFNQLDCYNNPNLTTINIKNGATQLLGSQTNYNQCWTGLPNLTTICLDSNEIIPLQAYLDNCGVDTATITFASNCALGVAGYSTNNVNIYPNPSKGLFTINSSNDAKLIIYDILGKVILKQDVRREFENTLDLTNYATGIYYAKIIDFNDNFKMFKLIKN